MKYLEDLHIIFSLRQHFISALIIVIYRSCRTSYSAYPFQSNLKYMRWAKLKTHKIRLKGFFCEKFIANIYYCSWRSKWRTKWSANANEVPLRIQYKCLVPIYVFPEKKLLFPKQNYNVSQFLHLYICKRFIHFQDWSAYSAACSAARNMWTDPGNCIF